MNYLVDTNVISEIRKGRRADPNVATWYDAVPEESLYLSVLVLGEIRRGIERKRPRDSAQAAALETWLAAVQRGFGGRLLPVDGAVADAWGRMGALRPVSVIDGLMAATAKVHGLILVTRNIADVRDLDVSLLDPFEPGHGRG